MITNPIYKLVIFRSLAQLYSQTCNVSIGLVIVNKQGGGMVCDSYFSIPVFPGKRTKQTVKNHAEGFHCVFELVKNNYFSQTNANFLSSFDRNCDKTIFIQVSKLCACVKYQMK